MADAKALNGVLCINKPQEFTSFDVVAKLRGITHTRKIGHAGTLDPMATGLLPVFFGTATKACDILPIGDKRYLAQFTLGVTSDTEDIWGTCEKTGAALPDREAVEAVLPRFRGEIMQVPPMYSALSIGGQKLYDLARKGIVVERTPRPITIHELTLIDYDEKSGVGSLDVSCSKGTYIRTLAADIGAALGTGAVMSSLCRTEAAGFTLSDAVDFDTVFLWMEKGVLSQKLLSPERLFAPYPALTLNEAQTRMFLNGVRMDLKRIKGSGALDTGTPWRIFGFDGEFLGIGQAFPAEGELRLVKFFRERG
ncbi:MAG: tRNA pseudouridine(55) synthase TruB [Oscillospiraceae bacterium]|nr:tRNA pseudouridine(55) synthase TruB [Oscillospiraceae bacterium]